MTDKELNGVLQYILSPDFRNVLLGIELYQQQSDFHRTCVAEAFLDEIKDQCVSMYAYASDDEVASADLGVFELQNYRDPKNHTGIGLKFQHEWTIWIEMDISTEYIYESSMMLGSSNLIAVAHYQEVSETAITSELLKPYTMEARMSKHHNKTVDCIDFFFNAIHNIIHSHINQEA
jgi:hypothetical protein